MKILATFDEANYQDTVGVYEKFSVRGIIIQNGKIAMQYGTAGEYKIPGGGPEREESYTQALIREVHEETGLRMIEESILELGEILEMRKDIFEHEKKYICHSLFYYGRAMDGQDEPKLTKSEIERGYRMKWAAPEEILEGNRGFANMPWIVRDTEFIRMLVAGRVVLPEKVAGIEIGYTGSSYKKRKSDMIKEKNE